MSYPVYLLQIKRIAMNSDSMKGKKNPCRLSALSVLVFAAFATSFFTSPTVVQAQASVNRPKIATVKSMTNGDIMCYVTLVDRQGKKYRDVGALFEICEKEKTFLNKKVRLSYRKVSVNDCQSAEPCGKTRQETLITKMQLTR